MGTDMISEISTWKDIDILSEMCSFIVVNRFPISINDTTQSSFLKDGLRGIRVLSDEKKAEIERLKVMIPPIGISSSEIRARLQKKCSIRYLVPRCVEDYIRANNLYMKG